MSIRSKLGRAGIIAAATAAIGVGMAGVASAAPAASAVPATMNGPVHGCVFQTANGHYLTAVGGGGRTTDTIHSDATRVGAWEKFTVSCGH